MITAQVIKSVHGKYYWNAQSGRFMKGYENATCYSRTDTPTNIFCELAKALKEACAEHTCSIITVYQNTIESTP